MPFSNKYPYNTGWHSELPKTTDNLKHEHHWWRLLGILT